MKPLLPILLLPLLVLGQSCVPINEPYAGARVDEYTDKEYMQLPAEDKYAVTNKLLSTLFKGTPARSFFRLQYGLSNPVLQQNHNHLLKLREQLTTPAGNLSGHTNAVLNKHFFDESRQANTRALPMAMLYQLPLSREYYHRWIAYQLTNNILFSPALELDSVAAEDVKIVYDNLVNWLDQGKTMSEIVYLHMISQSNWRRFRSPEDNTREMMEIFLMRFRDDEVPLAAIACKNWSLSDASQDYTLRISANRNYTPQRLLERNDIVSCYDFYDAVAKHDMLQGAVSRRIVDAMFPEYPSYARASLSLSVTVEDPIYFQDIYSNILFSREYLLTAERTKRYEETLLGTASRMYWYAHQDIYHWLNDGNPGSSVPDLQDMRQDNMSLKLGRENVVAQDSLAVSYYHKSIRDRLLLDHRTSTSSTTDGGWTQSQFINAGDVAALSNRDFIHYLMLTTVNRKASSIELAQLEQIINDFGYQNNRLNQAWVVLDYASRLTEFYAHMSIGGGA